MFERKDITTHTRAINEIVRKYCEENGLCFEPGNIKYSGTEFCYKCSVKTKDDSGYPALSFTDKWRMETLLQDAPEEVRKVGDVRGKKVHLHNGKTVKIVGFDASRPKYCWIIDVNGTTKCCSNSLICWAKGFAA